MQGILDFLKTPAGQGLLAAGLGAAASSGRGKGLLGNLGAGGLMGLQTYAGATDLQDRQAQEAQERKLRAMQIEQAERSMADQKLADETAKQYFKPGVPAIPGDANLPPELRTGAIPMPGQAPSFDLQGYAQARLGQNPTAGIQLLQQLQKDTPFNKVDPKDFTTESIAKFAQTRNYSDLQPRTKVEVSNGFAYDPFNTKAGTVLPNPNQPFMLGPNGQIVPNAPFQQYEKDKASAGAARTSVNVNADKSYFGNVAEGLAKNDVAAIEAGRNAPERILTSQKVREVLSRNPITGTGAEARLALNKAFATAGLIDGQNVADTEVLGTLLASQALDAIKTSGLGGGSGFSNADRDFLERARAGKIDMTAQALGRIADLNERTARLAIKRGNTIIGKLRMSPQAGQMGQQLDPIDEPRPPSVVRQPPAAGKPRFLGFE